MLASQSRVFSAPRRERQEGAAAVEFALVAMIFFTLLLGVAEWARALFVWNAAVEATRFGARVAVVCDLDSSSIVARMAAILPGLDASQVVVAYEPEGCNRDTCRSVSVSVQNLSVTPLVPFVSVTLPVPPYSTRIPRESLRSSNASGERNPVCFPGYAPAYPAPAAL